MCLPPSVKRFFTSSPCRVIKQYEAVNTNIPKNISVEDININKSTITFVIDQLMFSFISAITSIIIA